MQVDSTKSNFQTVVTFKYTTHNLSHFFLIFLFYNCEIIMRMRNTNILWAIIFIDVLEYILGRFIRQSYTNLKKIRSKIEI